MTIRKRLKGGFTLIELMIVVAIVGVLAVLAVYGVRKYIANAKTAEAKNSLGQMVKDGVTAFEGETMAGTVLAESGTTAVLRDVCLTGTVASVPATKASIQGKKYQSSKVDWSNAADVSNRKGYPCIKYEMTAPQYYMYGYSATTLLGTVNLAEGDLNGDTITSQFRMDSSVTNGRLLQAPSILEFSPEE